MILTIIVAFLSLIGLIVLHEFGHFIVARAVGIRVLVFSIGFGRKLWRKITAGPSSSLR